MRKAYESGGVTFIGELKASAIIDGVDEGASLYAAPPISGLVEALEG
ncbi:hypothetical protein WG219_11395 [Ectopseudomonas mendocina]|uniref:Uncharacterized protein n=1 Tax=Ectopseudomonas mendocina TaxID=300 RepID=A0ABZ2REI3_ECTME